MNQWQWQRKRRNNDSTHKIYEIHIETQSIKVQNKTKNIWLCCGGWRCLQNACIHQVETCWDRHRPRTFTINGNRREENVEKRETRTPNAAYQVIKRTYVSYLIWWACRRDACYQFLLLGYTCIFLFSVCIRWYCIDRTVVAENNLFYRHNKSIEKFQFVGTSWLARYFGHGNHLSR